MAGKCKPNGVGKEGRIAFGDYNFTFPERGKPIYLVDEIINQRANDANNPNKDCCVLMDIYWTEEFMIFSLPQRANIWSIGVRYADSGGVSNQSVDLYKLESGGQYRFIGKYPTNPEFERWYKLFDHLAVGTYKVVPTDRYASFSEWYYRRYSIISTALICKGKSCGLWEEILVTKNQSAYCSK